MPDNSLWIKLSVKNISLKRKLESIISTTQGVRFIKLESQPRVDLMIFELGSDIDKDFQLIQSVLNAELASEVFVVSEASNPDALLQAIKVGVKEFLSLPLNEKEVRQALDNFKERQGKRASHATTKTGKIVHVVGTKGGVGTTTVAVNLAVNFAMRTSRPSVALVDMNMLFGDIPLFLELRPKYHWGEVTKNIDRLDSTFLMNVLAKHRSGLHILPSPGYLNGYPAVTREIVEHLLGLMQRNFDIVVIDGGQSINQASLRALEISDSILLISLLSLPCLFSTNKILSSFDSLGLATKDQVKLVINRYLKKSEISVDDAEETVKRKISWTIPNDYKTTMTAINQGKALIEFAAKENVTKSFYELSEYLIPEARANQKRKWGLFK